jgi:tetratricopeptide (TPR) repeat protein
MIGDKAELLLDEAQAIFWQGRFGEAETLARESFKLSRKVRPQASLLLSEIYFESGRYRDSLRLALNAISLLDKFCAPSDAYQRARSYAGVARALIGLQRWADAAAMFDRLEVLLASDAVIWEARFKGSQDRGIALLRTERSAEALEVFRTQAASTRGRLGADNYQTLEAQALSAAALAELGNHAEALNAMRLVFFNMVERWQESAGDSVRFVGRLFRMRLIAEAYIRLLLDGERGGDPGDSERVAESFQVADAVATRGVQRALAESTARYLADDPATEDLIRQQQDLAKQIVGLRHRLNEATVSSEVTKETLQQLRNQVEQAETAELSLKRQIAELLPEYAALINPKPVSLPEVQAALDDGEALVLTFAGEDRLFVWAVPKTGPALAAVAPLGRQGLKSRVNQLRRALSPNVQTLGDIPRWPQTMRHCSMDIGRCRGLRETMRWRGCLLLPH